MRSSGTRAAPPEESGQLLYTDAGTPKPLSGSQGMPLPQRPARPATSPSSDARGLVVDRRPVVGVRDTVRLTQLAGSESRLPARMDHCRADVGGTGPPGRPGARPEYSAVTGAVEHHGQVKAYAS